MNLRSKWWPKDFSLGESINSGLFFINFSFSFIFALYYFIPLTVESPSKGETLGNVSSLLAARAGCSRHRFPPYTPGKPVGSRRLTPSGRPLSGDNVFAYRQTIDMEEPLFKLVKILTFLKFSRLKFDNSLPLKQSNFFTPSEFQKYLISSLETLRMRINSNIAMFGKAKRAW